MFPRTPVARATRLLGALAILALCASPRASGQGCTSACVPLMDLASGDYLGFTGGLYPGGRNDPPPAHAAAALRAAEAVVARDASGAPHPDGLVGVLSIGVSNLLLEWRAVTRRVEHDPLRNGELVLVNGAVGAAFSTALADPASFHWTDIEARVAAAGLSASQVQVVFIETATQYLPPRPFPQHALDLSVELAEVVRNAHDRFPNVRLAFVNSITYTGFSVFGVTEPLTFEQGFAVRWLIEAQINGDPGLVHDPWVGPVEAPVVLWGPYLWAFGATPRLDGFATPRAYFGWDGVHASRLGEERIADRFEAFFDQSEAARVVFGPRAGRARSAVGIDADATLDDAQPSVAFGAADLLLVDDGPRRALLRASFAPLTGLARLAHAKLCLEPAQRALRVQVVGVSDTTWDEATVTAATAPAFDGATSGALAITSQGALAEWGVTPQVSAAPAGVVALGLVGTLSPTRTEFLARESVNPGWLALAIDEAPGGVVAHCPGRVNSTGVAARLAATGSASISADDLDLEVADAPPGASLFPFAGPGAREVTLAGRELCVGAPLTRLPPLVAGVNGRAAFHPTWGALPGEARTIQVLFRDSAPGGLRTTNALTIVFRP